MNSRIKLGAISLVALSLSQEPEPHHTIRDTHLSAVTERRILRRKTQLALHQALPELTFSENTEETSPIIPQRGILSDFADGVHETGSAAATIEVEDLCTSVGTLFNFVLDDDTCNIVRANHDASNLPFARQQKSGPTIIEIKDNAEERRRAHLLRSAAELAHRRSAIPTFTGNRSHMGRLIIFQTTDDKKNTPPLPKKPQIDIPIKQAEMTNIMIVSKPNPDMSAPDPVAINALATLKTPDDLKKFLWARGGENCEPTLDSLANLLTNPTFSTPEWQEKLNSLGFKPYNLGQMGAGWSLDYEICSK